MIQYLKSSIIQLFTIIFFLFFSSTKAQDYKWGKQFGNGEQERIVSIEIDDDGNSYILGESTSYYFDLDPGPGEVIIENNTLNISGNICFLIKLDEDGNYIWGKVFNMIRQNNDHVIDLKIGTDNNLYVGMVLLHEYYGNTIIPFPNIMIVKLDLNGNELMAKSIKNQNSNSNSGINISHFDLDQENNIYFTGYFTGNVTLDNSNPSFNLNANNWGNYVLKMDSNGEYLWKTVYDYQASYFEDIKIGPDGNINLILETINENENFSILRLIKLSASSGNLVWEKNFIEFSPIAFHVAQNGNILISGIRGNSSNPPTDVDPSSNTSLTIADNFLVWFTPNGNFIELKEYFLPGLRLNVMTSDNENNYYFAGVFSGTIDADPSPSIFNLTSSYTESFTVKFNSNREFENAFKLGKPYINGIPHFSSFHNLSFTDIKIKNGNTFYSGIFAGVADLDPSSNVDFFDSWHGNSTNHPDGFMFKIGQCDLAAPTASPDQYFCSSQNATIQNLLPNSSSIEWYDSLMGGNLLINTTPLIDGTVYYASRSIGSCTGTALRLAVTAHISINPPDPIVSNMVFCASDNTTLSDLIVTGQDLKWYSGLTGQTLLNLNTVLINGTTYYVSQTVNACESNRVPVLASINTPSLPVSDATVFYCKQENKALADIAITGQNIKWYDAQTGGNLLPDTVLLENNHIYYASQTINGCESDRISVTVTVYDTPHPIGFAVQYFCDTLNLTLADFEVTGTDIIFYDSQFGGNVLPLSTPLVDDAGYWASQTLNGCESMMRLPLISDIISSLPANDYAVNVCDDQNDGKEKVDLSSYSENIIAASHGYSFTYYTDQASAENEIAANEITNFSGYELQSGMNIIYVRVENTTLCYKVIKLQLNVIASPVLYMKDTYEICEGSAKTITADPGFYTYTWSTTELSQSITVTEPGTYSVTVTEYHGDVICGTTKDITVVTSNRATITSIEATDWTSDDNMLTVFVTGLGDYEYSIDGEHYQSSNQFTGLENGEYMVYVRDINGCGITREEVYLLMYPKFFSPNGDGYNDFWGIRFYKNELNMVVKIYDRYGNFIKQLTDTDPFWDGSYNGQVLPATDYWFSVIRENGKEYKGHFSLKR